jgi:hypothetical protein
MTDEQVKVLYESEFWKTMSLRDIATFQLLEPKLCMPFRVFHAALEATLGRPVWTHELALNYDGLVSELMGDRPKPTFEDICNLIPAEKRIVVVVPDEE